MTKAELHIPLSIKYHVSCQQVQLYDDNNAKTHIMQYFFCLHSLTFHLSLSQFSKIMILISLTTPTNKIIQTSSHNLKAKLQTIIRPTPSR